MPIGKFNMFASNFAISTFISLFVVVFIPICYSEPFTTENEPASCPVRCGKKYSTLSDWLACTRGCRFFTLIDLIAKPQHEDCTKESCINTCTEAYNETALTKACSEGCGYEYSLILGDSFNHPEHNNVNMEKKQGLEPIPLFGWLHFPPIMDLQTREQISYPIQLFNDLLSQFSERITSSSNWIRSHASYSIMFGSGEGGKQRMIVIRSKSSPQFLTLDDGEVDEQSKSSEIENNVDLFNIKPNQPLESLEDSSSSNQKSAIPLSQQIFDTLNAEEKKHSFSRPHSSLFKDVQLLMAIMLAIIIISLLTMKEGPFNFIRRRRSEPKSETPFFILDNNQLKKEQLIKEMAKENKQDDSTKEANEKPPTYEETLTQPALNVRSLLAYESKA